MPKLILTATALTAVLTFAAAPVLAREAGPMRGGAAALPQASFAEIDADGDGRITLEEWTAFLQARRDAMRAQAVSARVDALFDAAGAGPDDALSRDDMAAAMATLQERAGERRAERGAHGRGWRHGRGHDRGAWRGYHGRAGSTGDWAERSFARIDSDGDGAISPQELEAAQERWQARAERRAERMAERRERREAGRGDGRSPAAE